MPQPFITPLSRYQEWIDGRCQDLLFSDACCTPYDERVGTTDYPTIPFATQARAMGLHDSLSYDMNEQTLFEIGCYFALIDSAQEEAEAVNNSINRIIMIGGMPSHGSLSTLSAAVANIRDTLAARRNGRSMPVPPVTSVDDEPNEDVADHQCVYCESDITDLDESVFVNGGYWCPTCRDNHLYQCSVCGDWLEEHEYYISPDNNYLCGYHYDNECTTCARCGDTIWRSDANYDDYDEEYYCDDHFHQREYGVGVCGYHECDKTVKFFSMPGEYIDTLTPYTGIEVEVEAPDSRSEDGMDSDVEAIKEFMPEGLLFFEHDGSLSWGFEIVTAPMTRKYFDAHRADFEKMLLWLSAHGYRSHQTTTCGLHFHITRCAFGSPNVQEQNMTKAVFMVERFWSTIMKLSRRDAGEMRSWADRYHTTNHYEIEGIVKSKGGGARYRAINFTPRNTVEFRCFRGTLKPDTFFATYDMVWALIDGVCTTDLYELVKMRKFMSVLKRGGAKKNLVTFVKSLTESAE